MSFTKTNAAVFPGIAAIAVAGDPEPGLIAFAFRNMKRSAFDALMQEIKAGEKTESAALAELIDGWDAQAKGSLVTGPYSAVALADLLDEFWCGGEIVKAYVLGRAEAKEKNSK